MNDEIKEILEDLRNKNMSVDDLTHNDKTKLLDYITNLQKENEKLLKKSYSDDVKITKAIELISKEFLCYDNESDEYTQGKKAINILNGGDEE